MKDKKYIIFFSGFLVLLIIIYLILRVTNGSESNKLNTLNDDKTYFLLTNIINNEYQDPSYLDSQYVLENVYYKEDELQTTYFIKAFQLYKYFNDNEYIKEDLKYIITIKGIGYKLEELNVNNLEDYINTYESTDINTTDLLPSISYQEQDKLAYYLSVFKKLLKVSPIKAYNSLTEKEQKKYTNYQDFLNKTDQIYNQMNTTINSYQKNKNTYTIHTSNKTITLIENSIMNYKIEY